jgi:heat-inducible transcriptional repressor
VTRVRFTKESALNSRRNRGVLGEIVRAYVQTGEPVSSRAISQVHPESLSPATIRNIMGELEEAGYLYQKHTSAGRVPTAEAYRFFAQQAAADGRVSEPDRAWIREQLGSAASAEEMTERAGHILAEVSQGLGIVLMPRLSGSVLNHIRFLRLPDGRVVVVLLSAGGVTRDKIVRPEQEFSQAELDRTAIHLNAHYAGWTLEAIRADLRNKLDTEQERYGRLLPAALELCDPALLESDANRQMYVEGAAQFASAPEFATAASLRELLSAIEEKSRLVDLLDACIEAPEPVHIQIGVKEITAAGEHLALIAAPYSVGEQARGSLGILGPMRMQYERAITAVAFLARAFSETLNRS